MTMTLCGFPLSNYHNKAKMVLLEKGVPFVERRIDPTRKDADLLAASPLGKVPFLVLDDGRTLCESQAIAEYAEAAFPEPPLLPADPWAAAKVRELCMFLDLHLELVARDLYGKAFFGGEISEGNAARVRKLLQRNLAAFKQLASFAPYVAGERFTLADCSAYNHLPLIKLATRAVFGEDLVAGAGIELKPYVERVGARPSAQRVATDRKADPNLVP